MRRKLLSYIGFSLIIQLLFCSVVSASEQARLWFEMKSEASGYTVTLNLDGKSEPEMLQFCIEFDNDRLELVSISEGEVFKETNAPTLSNNEEGKIYFVWDALSPLNDGRLLVMQFRTKEGVTGTAHIGFAEDYEVIAADDDLNEIYLTLEGLDIELDDNQQNDSVVPPIDDDKEHTIVIKEGDSIVIDNTSAIIWDTNNEDTVTVENGNVTAVSEGFAQVVAESEDGTQETYYVTVLNEQDYEKHVTAKGERKTLKYLVYIGIGLSIMILMLLMIRKGHKTKRNEGEV